MNNNTKKPYYGDHKYAVKYHKSMVRHRSDQNKPKESQPVPNVSREPIFVPPSPIPNPLFATEQEEQREYRPRRPSMMTSMAQSLLREAKRRGRITWRDADVDVHDFPELDYEKHEPYEYEREEKHRKHEKEKETKIKKKKKKKKSIAISGDTNYDPKVLQLVKICIAIVILMALVFLGVIVHQRNAIFLSNHSRAKYIKHPKVLLFHPVKMEQDPYDELRLNYNAKVIQISTKRLKTRQQFLDKLKKYQDFNILVTSKWTDGIIGSLDDEIIEALPPTCVAIINSDLHYNATNINLLTSRNVQISYNINTELKDNSTADTHVFLMLSAMRNYHQSIQNFLKSVEENAEYESFWRSKPWFFDWPPQPVEYIYEQSGKADSGFLPNGKRLGIMGMNGVGKAIALRVKNFNFQSVVYNSEYQLPKHVEEELGLSFVSLEELIVTSDVISVNIEEEFPLREDSVRVHTPESDVSRKENGDIIKGSRGKYYHMVNSRMISKMKDHVVIVNTASEKLLNLKSVYKYLGKKVKAIAMDSIDFSDKLMALKMLRQPNVIVTPKTNLYSQQVLDGDDAWVVKNIKNFLESGRVLNIVPEQRLMKFNFDYFVV